MDRWRGAPVERQTGEEMDKWRSGQVERWTGREEHRWSDGQVGVGRWQGKQVDRWRGGEVNTGEQVEKWTREEEDNDRRTTHRRTPQVQRLGVMLQCP